ncbi:MAG TPA: hypothetical protein VNL39_08670 [Xanthobacteraceae bacterium]|nr:hypothetical protein [Xanthobacteraceae bacterium]
MGDRLRSSYRRATTTAVLSLACLISLLSAVQTRAQGACEDAAELAVLVTPLAPWRGAPLRVVFAAEQALDGELALIAPDGSVAARSRERRGGPPYFWLAEVAAPAAGTWRARLVRDGAPGTCRTITREIAVRADAPPRPGTTPGSVWPLRGTWNRATENLFSVWIEKLFDDPLETAPSWPALHEVLRDRSRNILFNHLGLGEDEMGMTIRPDCADLPYFLRAYFAFKVGLPFGYSNCSRGGGGKPPRCYQWFSIQDANAARPSASEEEGAGSRPTRRAGLAASFGEFLRTVANTVHSGTGRTPAADNNTDYYPVALSAQTLRPGTVYADPYGHILMITRRVPQADGSAGILLAVDGQPDGTVARKRFWRGNFLFAQDPALGGPGFKRFRPVVLDKSGALRRLSNEEIARHPQYGDFSLEQTKLSVEDFYDRMDEVLSPVPLDPLRAMMEAITALEEQVKARVTSVENGRKWQMSARGTVAMPDGAAIFETTGPWEDFSTPSRDLRLLIAIDVVRGFPDRVARRPERYAMPQGKSVAEVKTELQSVLTTELAARKFSYPRSDGSPWTLSIKDVVERASLLEMAYNPNDCVEIRWGAAENSEEASTCKRFAPAAQRAKMVKYRPWFYERRRPPRP